MSESVMINQLMEATIILTKYPPHLNPFSLLRLNSIFYNYTHTLDSMFFR